MRSKCKSSTEMVIDYSKARCECVIVKKKLFGQVKRYIYVFDQHLVINKEAKKKKYDRLLLVELTKRVIWKYFDKKNTKCLKGFTLDYVDKSYEYLGEEQELLRLKKHLALLIFQARVQDEYEAQQVVGQGNYALVLELKHLHSDTRLASKCIDKKKLEAIENGMKSVMNEIQIMRLLSPHPLIVNLHEVYEGDNNIYLIMDLAQGGSLYQEMKHRKYLFSRKEIQQIMKTILTAVGYMHEKGIMHRDLKPENILYQVKGDHSSLKIADFGLSTLACEYPYLYPKCGTPGFVAPEVANLTNKQEGYGVNCDVFSIGVIFHVLLFGEGVFAGKGHHDILRLNKKCEINYLHKRYDQIDSDAKDLLLKMIDKDPNTRWSINKILAHDFFSVDYEVPYPKLLKESSTEVGEVKYHKINIQRPISPGSQSPFHNYTQENALSPQDNVQMREKKHSIVTRTPIYKQPPEQPQQDALSDFDLEAQNEEESKEEVMIKRNRYLSAEFQK